MKCDRCGGAAVYSRRYSGQSLCSGCFSDSIVQKTARTISNHSMIRRGETVVVAVSGGKDSLSLLHVLERLSGKGGFHIRAVTIDEGIPGYRDEALGIVEEYCGKMGIECSVWSYRDIFGATLEDVLEARRSGGSSCSTCGTLRRRAMDMAAGDADALATAHNLDDTLQTFMINMLSGDTAKIGRMGPSQGTAPRKIKPFCEIYESEIVFYAFTNGIPFQTEPCPHMNEGIRTGLREFLNSLEEDHSGIKNSMYRSVQRVVRHMPEAKAWQECATCGSRCTGDTCAVCGIVGSLNANITRISNTGR